MEVWLRIMLDLADGVLTSRMGPWACPRRLSCSELTSYLGANPGGTLGAAGLLVDPSLSDGQAAKSCIIAMSVMYPLMDGLSVEQEY